MGIRIELNSDSCTQQEWRALVAFASLMTGGELLAPEESNLKEKLAQAEHDLLVERGRAPPTKIAPADNPAAGIDTDATLQAAGFGSGTVAPPVPVPAAGAVPSVPPATPPAPPVTATAPAGTPPVSTGNVQLDSKGLPWDHRIHSSERTQNKDGSWRNKRGLPDGTVAQVEAELRAVLGVAAPPPPVPGTPLVPPAPGTPAAPMTFMTLLTKVTKAIKDGQLAQDRVNATLVEFSLPNLPAIHHRPDLVQGFHDRLFGAA